MSLVSWIILLSAVQSRGSVGEAGSIVVRCPESRPGVIWRGSEY
jgi:hypothetical protein